MEIIFLFILLICFVTTVVVCLFFLFQIISIFTTDAPFVPIPDGIDQKIIDCLKLSNESVLYDLGCGDGRVLRYATWQYPQLKSIGVEVAFVPYFLAKFKTRKNKNIEIRRENIFQTDVKDATHIFVYLFADVLDKLIPMLKQKCKPGTRIVSCDFACSQIEPSEIIETGIINNPRGKRLVVYTI